MVKTEDKMVKTGYGEKIQHIINELKKCAFEKGPEWKLPTISKLCSIFSTTPITIDKALSTLERKQIIYRTRGSGIYVSPTIFQKTIAIVFGWNIFSYSGVSKEVFNILLKKCEERIQKNTEKERFSVYLDIPEIQNDLSSTMHTHYQLQRDIESGEIDGVISLIIRDLVQLSWFQKTIPTVSFSMLGKKGTVHADFKKLIEIGTNSLIKEKCSKIGLITGFGYLRKQKYHGDIKGYIKTIKDFGLEYKPEYIWDNRMEERVETLEETGYRATKEILTKNKNLHGLVITHDTMTIGAIAAMQNMGIKPGKDIKIATHSNKYSPVLNLNMYKNNLILIEIDTDEVVNKIFDLLERQMAGKKIPDRKILIQPYLIKSGR